MGTGKLEKSRLYSDDYLLKMVIMYRYSERPRLRVPNQCVSHSRETVRSADCASVRVEGKRGRRSSLAPGCPLPVGPI